MGDHPGGGIGILVAMGPEPTPSTGRCPAPVGASWWTAACVTAIAVHAFLCWLYYRPAVKELWGDESRYLESATRLLAGDPGWHPGLLWPPLYPRFVAGILAVGQTLVAVQAVQTLLLVVAAAVLWDLCRRLTGSAVAAAAAAFLTVAFPPLAAFAHYLWPEVVHLLLFLVVLWVVVTRPRSWWWAALGGVALGLALLAKNLLLPFVPVLVVAAAWPARGAGGARRVREAVGGVGPILLLVGVAGVTVAPTVVTNYRSSGVAAIADSSAFNLWVGLNETSHRPFTRDVAHQVYREFTKSAPTFAERNRILWTRIRDRFRERPLPEILRGQLGRQYFLLLDKDSYLTEQLPGGAAPRQGDGYVAAPPAVARVVRAVSYAAYALLLVAAPLGFATWRPAERRWVVVLLLFVAYNLGLFLWLHAATRYQVQMLPVAFVGAGAAVAWLAGDGGGRRQDWRGRVLAGVAAAVLLFFAFAGVLL